jgi:hypothetical protein
MSATTFSNPSDRRLKANVNSLEARAKHIFTLNGVSFNYKRKVINSSPPAAKSTSVFSSTGGAQRQLGAVSADGVVDTNSTYFGFIAQEVEGQFPELVGRDSQGFRSVQYSAFVPLIIEGMKEQRSDLFEQRSDSSELRSELAEVVKAQQSEIDGLRSQLREELREAGVLLSLPSPSATTTTRTVSVKGLSATGAVTAHHDLVHTRRTGVLAASTGREAVGLDGEETGESRRRSGAQGGEQTEGTDEAFRRRMEEELLAVKAEARRVEAKAEAETRRVEAETKEAKVEMEEKLLAAEAKAEEKLMALLRLVEDLTKKVEGSGGTRGGA